VVRAESIFRDDDEFFVACREANMDFTANFDIAAMIFCWVKGSGSSIVVERIKWFEKARYHAINAASNAKNRLSDNRSLSENAEELLLNTVANVVKQSVEEELK
jgi:hypothetical protein